MCQVSLRKQEIADRLNAWVIFNEKNKELCDWLSQMEHRVSDDSDITIEDMVEKLKKVCVCVCLCVCVCVRETEVFT